MIELSNVHKRFGSNEVLKGITASVEKSEVVCIIGPSGSGKSTILRCINGLESYDSGEILVEGAKVDNKAPSIVAIRTQVSMVFQRFNLFPHRTALENVIEGPVYVKGEPRAAATERGRALLARVGLADKAALPATQLTYIDQKRLELARALALDPDLLLLDEWLAGLNPTELAQGIALIRSLRESGITIVMVEHVMDAIRSLCDRCVVMNVGRKIAEGPPASVLADRQVVQAYLGGGDA